MKRKKTEINKPNPISVAIAEAMKRIYSPEAKIVSIKMLFVDEVRSFVEGIDEAHRRAKNSTLRFKAAAMAR